MPTKKKRFRIKDLVRWRAARSWLYRTMGNETQFTDARVGLLMLGAWFEGYDAGRRRGRRERSR